MSKFLRWVTLTQPLTWEWPTAEHYALVPKFYSTGIIVRLLGTISQVHRSTKVKLHPLLLSRSALLLRTMQITAQKFSIQLDRSTTRPTQRFPADLQRISSQYGSKTPAKSTLWPQAQNYQTTSTRLIRALGLSRLDTLQVYQLQPAPWQLCAKFFQNRNATGKAAT